MNKKAELAFLYQFLVYLVLGMGEKIAGKSVFISDWSTTDLKKYNFCPNLSWASSPNSSSENGDWHYNHA